MASAVAIVARVALLLLLSCSNRLDLGHDRDGEPLGSGGAASASGGATGSSCDGVSCFAGPVVDLAHSKGSAKGLVLDATTIYWAATAAQALMVTPKDGGATLANDTPAGGPYRVAASESHVYFTSDVGGYVASLDKTTLAISPLVSPEPYPESIAVGSDGVYFADQHVGTLKRAAFDASSIDTLATGIHSGGHLALDAEFLYYADSGLGEIHAIDRTTLANQLLVNGRAAPNALLPRGEDLYFVDLGTAGASYGDGKLLRMPRRGGPVEVLLEGLDAPTGLAADDTGVFVCTRGIELNDYRGRILRRSNEGVTSTLATNQWQAFAIAVDERAVYWTTDSDGGLHAILR
jgi:sugar lactone lactonase YvrE